MLRFCTKEGVSRSGFLQQALYEALERHCPELRPEGSISEMLKERWELKGTGKSKGVVNGPSKATLEESSAMKLERQQQRDSVSNDPEGSRVKR